MMSPRLHDDIARVTLAAVYGHLAHPVARDRWWDAVVQFIAAPADDRELAWARLVARSEILWPGPVAPREEPTR
jgi:hypothetical protein